MTAAVRRPMAPPAARRGRLLLPLVQLALLGRGAAVRLHGAPGKGTSLSASLAGLTQAERLQAAKPFSWVHVPKTGAVLMNAVIFLPGVCKGLDRELPRDWLCSGASSESKQCDAYSWGQAHGGFRSAAPALAPAACPGIQRWCLHMGFNTQYLTGHKGHGLVMLRQPEQRVLSGYYNPNDHHGWKPEWREPRSVLEYAWTVQGVSVKILARDGMHYWVGPPSQGETELAVRRLREGFAFVGITEEYELSLCMLHAMFGNECHEAEFDTWHVSRHRRDAADGGYDVSELQGFKDVWDRQVFAEGMRIFRENLDLYNVSKESCMPCFRRANLSEPDLDGIGRFLGSWDPSA